MCLGGGEGGFRGFISVARRKPQILICEFSHFFWYSKCYKDCLVSAPLCIFQLFFFSPQMVCFFSPRPISFEFLHMALEHELVAKFAHFVVGTMLISFWCFQGGQMAFFFFNFELAQATGVRPGQKSQTQQKARPQTQENVRSGLLHKAMLIAACRESFFLSG